jgi:hypothetical protein
MGFSGTGATHKNEIIRLIHETAGCELLNVRFFQKTFFLLIGCRNCVKLALKNGGVNPFFYANKKRPVMALSFVSKLSAL